MNFFRSGGYGTVTGIQLRGLPKRYSTVFIDGVKMSDPSSSDNSFYFSNIMKNSVSQVEVLKGSQSSIYGSGAIGGTINIYTKTGKNKRPNSLSYSKGSNGLNDLGFTFGKDLGYLNYYFGYNFFNTNGISAMNDELITNDRDGYKNEGIISNVEYIFGNNLSLKNSLRFSNSSLKYDEVTSGRTDENNRSEDDELTYSISLSKNFEKFKSNLAYNYTNIERSIKTYTNEAKNYYGYRNAINYIGTYFFDLDNKLIFGSENEFDKAKFQKDWPTDYLVSDEAVYSQFIDFQTRIFNNLYSTIGLRRDDHTTAGSHDTKRLTLAYRINSSSKIRSSYGTGLRFPTLYDYSYGTTVSHKEELKPEKSRSFDLGYEGKLEKIRSNLNISIFKIIYEDPLESWNSNSWKIKNSNGKIKSEGLELSINSKINKKFSMNLFYNFNETYDGADCDDPDIGNNCIDESMVRVPKQEMTLGLNYFVDKKKENGLFFNYSDEVRDYGNANNSFKDVILDDYIKVDYSFKNKFNSKSYFFFNIENLFDENYENAYMYSTNGRGFKSGIKIKF